MSGETWAARRQSISRLSRSIALRNPIRHARVRREQREALVKRGVKSHRAIIFLLPGYDRADGGLMSIASIAEESENLSYIHHATVYACPFPRDPPLSRYTQFSNNLTPVNFYDLIEALPRPGGSILFHVPECYVPTKLVESALEKARSFGFVLQINIMLQNIDYCPPRDKIDRLRRFGKISITTAHKRYSTSEVETALGCPLFHLSARVDPSQYKTTPYTSKNDLIMLSPDLHPMRDTVINTLQTRLPEYTLKVVRDMHYRDYLTLCEVAKFSITFGEGLDGYYIEPVFSGGVAIAVYNDRFFTSEYKSLPLLYDRWEELIQHLPRDLSHFDKPEAYAEAHAKQYAVAAADYKFNEYIENLTKFYEEETIWSNRDRCTATRTVNAESA